MVLTEEDTAGAICPWAAEEPIESQEVMRDLIECGAYMLLLVDGG
jgi:hypothetical protein